MLGDRDYMKEEARRYSFGGTARRNMTAMPVWLKLIIACVIVFILQKMSPAIEEALVFGWSTFTKAYIWTPFTYMFAHGGFMHLAFNMWGLYIFGSMVEPRIGGKSFFRLYIFAGLIALGIWALVNLGQETFILGASGALFGVMAAAAMVAPHERIMLLIPPIPLTVRTLVIVFAVMETFMHLGSSSGSNVAHIAHLGGLFGGWLYIRRMQKGKASMWDMIDRAFRKGRKKKSSGYAKGKKPDLRWAKDVEPTNEPEEEFDSSEVDRILDKIGQEGGIKSLSAREKRILEQARRKWKREL